jgi:NAD(P)-dependent dehydrogenase (short-subunit alcohol dehydrogenase family)
MSSRTVLALGGLLCGTFYGLNLAARRKRGRFSFRGRSIVITGGSRGLGLVLARQLAQRGARVALLARDQDELKRAEGQVLASGGEVLTIACDVRRHSEVDAAIEQVVDTFGSVDVLINNAGVIQVGPLEHMTVKDFEDALAIHLYAPLYCSLAVLPHMRRLGEGRIVNISSVGGKIAVPHLVPYCASKFALTGLSDGLRAELRRENIFVTTVCPGLMRTGSPGNAMFKGKHKREYAWFAISDLLPLLSVDAERAARQILRACRLGSARLTIGIHTKGAVLLNELFPETVTGLLATINRLLPNAAAELTNEHHPGFDSESRLAPRWLTRLSREAAERNNERRQAPQS